jgi:hypothetical protein
MHSNVEDARNDIWKRPEKDGKKEKRPAALRKLLGRSKREEP